MFFCWCSLEGQLATCTQAGASSMAGDWRADWASAECHPTDSFQKQRGTHKLQNDACDQVHIVYMLTLFSIILG